MRHYDIDKEDNEIRLQRQRWDMKMKKMRNEDIGDDNETWKRQILNMKSKTKMKHDDEEDDEHE